MKNTVLFDLDGTLLDTAPELADAMNKTLQQHARLPLDFNTFRQNISAGTPSMIKHSFAIEPDNHLYAQIRADFLDHYINGIGKKTTLFSGMQAVLNTITDKQMQWGIVTNKPAYLTEPLLDALKLSPHASCVISGDTLPKRKPDPDQILHACDLLGITPHDCVYVGDTKTDIMAAKQANVTAVAVTYGYHDNTSTPHEWQADFIINHPEELIEWLLN